MRWFSVCHCTLPTRRGFLYTCIVYCVEHKGRLHTKGITALWGGWVYGTIYQGEETLDHSKSRSCVIIVTWGLCFVGNDTTDKVRVSGVQVLHEFCQRFLKHRKANKYIQHVLNITC